MTIRDSSSQEKYPAVWTHSKGGEYVILGFCVIEKDCIPAVRYMSLKDCSQWVRPCSEFFDGRFKPEIK